MLKKLSKISGYKFSLTSFGVTFPAKHKKITNFYAATKNKKLKPVFLNKEDELSSNTSKQYISISVHFTVKPLETKKANISIYFLEIMKNITEILVAKKVRITQTTETEIVYGASLSSSENIHYTLLTYPIDKKRGSKGFNCSLIKTVYVKRFL